MNVWKLGAGPTVEGAALKFRKTSSGWDACGRKNTTVSTSDRVDSIGVSITYDYDFVTPLGSLMGAARHPPAAHDRSHGHVPEPGLTQVARCPTDRPPLLRGPT